MIPRRACRNPVTREVAWHLALACATGRRMQGPRAGLVKDELPRASNTNKSNSIGRNGDGLQVVNLGARYATQRARTPSLPLRAGH